MSDKPIHPNTPELDAAFTALSEKIQECPVSELYSKEFRDQLWCTLRAINSNPDKYTPEVIATSIARYQQMIDRIQA